MQLLSNARPLIRSPIVSFKLVMLLLRLLLSMGLLIRIPVVSLRARLCVALKPLFPLPFAILFEACRDVMELFVLFVLLVVVELDADMLN